MTRLHIVLSLCLVVCLVFGSLISPRVSAFSLNHEIIVTHNSDANDVGPTQDTESTGLQFRVSLGAAQPAGSAGASGIA